MNYIGHKRITNVQGLIAYIGNNSEWSTASIRNVITALGFRSNGGLESLKGLSGYLADSAKHGADSGFPGFTYYSDTIRFFKQNRKDIVINIGHTAAETGTDIIKLVQSFGIFRCSTPPASWEVGKALCDSTHIHDELTTLYNVFAWYALEEISHIWYRYLEDNPAYYAELST
ncbi:MAG: hypothetical protein LBB83_06925 [Treponema sp.]|jgi:hypothetical protein|nr:hypothetical protein [Treponema sp.]